MVRDVCFKRLLSLRLVILVVDDGDRLLGVLCAGDMDGPCNILNSEK